MLTSLPNGLFNDSSELKTLFLSNNRLEKIESNAFANLAQLQELYLQDNRLEGSSSSLNAQLFAHLNGIYLIELGDDNAAGHKSYVRNFEPDDSEAELWHEYKSQIKDTLHYLKKFPEFLDQFHQK
jgi:Leucine-rich repeat (LRR) protein